MKRKQITAILMSAIMTVSACMPMNSMQAMAAENAGASGTAAEAAVTAEQPDEAQDTGESEEPQVIERQKPEMKTERTPEIVCLLRIPATKMAQLLKMQQ